MKTEKPNNPRAFPLVIANKESNFLSLEGLTLLDYFIAHAPSKPLWDFDVPMESKKPKPINKRENSAPMALMFCINKDEIRNWNEIYRKTKAKMWPSEWASEQLKQRLKYL